MTLRTRLAKLEAVVAPEETGAVAQVARFMAYLWGEDWPAVVTQLTAERCTPGVHSEQAPDVPLLDKLLEVEHPGGHPALHAGHRTYPGLLRRLGHLGHLAWVHAQRPLAVHVLAGGHRGEGDLPVPGHADGDGDRLDVGMLHQAVVVGEGMLRAGGLGGFVGGLLMGGADRGQLALGQAQDRGDVAAPAPPAVDRGADDADAEGG